MVTATHTGRPIYRFHLATQVRAFMAEQGFFLVVPTAASVMGQWVAPGGASARVSYFNARDGYAVTMPLPRRAGA